MEKSCKVEIKCGQVNPDERDEIKELYLRKIALNELFLSLSKLETSQIDKLYNRIVMDMGQTSVAFQSWWDKKSKEHNWEAEEGATWRIDFDTCEIYLVKLEA